MRETSPKDKEAETVWEVATKEAIQGAPRESGTGRDSQPVKDAGHGGSGALGSSGISEEQILPIPLHITRSPIKIQ